MDIQKTINTSDGVRAIFRFGGLNNKYVLCRLKLEKN